MKNISQDAGLDQIYTNHCIRATCITVLDNTGTEARHIMSVSGHKSENSIRSYSKTRFDLKRKISNILSSTITLSPPAPVKQRKADDHNIPLNLASGTAYDISDHDLSVIDFTSSSYSSSRDNSSLMQEKQNQKRLRDTSLQRNFDFGVNFESSQIIDNSNRITPASISSIFSNNSTFNNCTFNFGSI